MELENALETAERFAPDSDRGLDDRWLVEEVIVEAARLVANPNIEAAVIRLRDGLDKSWDQLSDDQQVMWLAEAKEIVAAALTPGAN